MPKSSRKRARQILGVIEVDRAERMLREWVNTDFSQSPLHMALATNANAWERLFRLYREIPSVTANTIIPMDMSNWDRFHQQMEMAESVAECLRRAWDAPDLRRFEWFTWKAQREYEWEAAQAKHNVTPSHMHALGDETDKAIAAILESDEPPTVITPVEAAIFHLRHNRDRALHCPNPECPAPYFFQTKKGQKFCSPECAKPSQRAAKRKWWAENRAKEKE